MEEGKGGVVLIVDDAAENIHTLAAILREDYAILAAASAAKPLSAPSSRLKILVVDDEPVGRMALQVILERMDHEVDFAGDGAEALECIRAKSFDCVFMDIQMPRMNGIVATRTLRSDPTYRDSAQLHVVAMSGDRELFLADGMDDYVAKPVSIADIEDSLARRLARR